MLNTFSTNSRCMDNPGEPGISGHGATGVGEGTGGQLVLTALTKRYPGFVAVNAVSIEVPSGEFLTLLGPSGSGKTTTLMMVAGFTTPSGGDILLNGRSITSLAPERRNIGVVFQNYALFPHMSVFDNVAFPLRMRRQPRDLVEKRVRSTLRLVQLAGMDERLPRQLSGGQQQRVAIARALVFGPDLLLMDEPLGALDKNLRAQMQFELKRLHTELGVTILYVTHDQEEALTMSDRIALMNKGAIEQLGPADELYNHPINRFVAEFIGESNIIEGRLEGAGDAAHAWFVAARGAHFPILRPDANCGGGKLQAGQHALLVLRPEKLSLVGQGQGECIVGRVKEQVYVGDFTRYRVEVQGGLTLAVKVQNGRNAPRAREGEAVGISLDPRDIRILEG